MAPEQVEHPEAVDHRADIYALGMVFYQMLTGQLPAKPIEPPSRKIQLDVRLDKVVLRALEKNPETRYQQASVLKTQVETIVATPSDSVAAQAHLQPPRTNMNRNTNKLLWLWTVSAVVAVCLVVLGLAWFHQGKPVNYVRSGDAKQGKQDWEGAIADYTKAIELGPDDGGAYHQRGDAKRSKNDWDGAIADYTKAIELKPDDAGAYLNRSLAKQAIGDLDSASADHRKALELKPDSASH